MWWHISQFQLLHIQKNIGCLGLPTDSLQRVYVSYVAMKPAGRIWLSFFDRFIFSGWEETTSISKQCWNPNNIDGSLQSVKSNDKPSMTHNNNPGKDGKYNIMWQHMATPIINIQKITINGVPAFGLGSFLSLRQAEISCPVIKSKTVCYWKWP